MLPIEPTVLVMLPARSPVMFVTPEIEPTVTNPPAAMPLADTVNEVNTSVAKIEPVAVMPLPIVTAAMSPSVSTAPVALIGPVSSPVTVIAPIPPSFDVTLPSKSPATEILPMLVAALMAPVRSPACVLSRSAKTVMLPIEPTFEVMLPVKSPVMLVSPVRVPTVTFAAEPPAETTRLVRLPSATMLPPVAPALMVTVPMLPLSPTVASSALMLPPNLPMMSTSPMDPSVVCNVPFKSPVMETALATLIEPACILDPALISPTTVICDISPLATISELFVMAAVTPLSVMAPILIGSIEAPFIAAPPAAVTVVVPITLPVMSSLTLFIASAVAAVPTLVMRMLPVTSPATARATSALPVATTVGTVAPAPVVWAVKEARSFPTEMRLALLVAKLSALPVVLVRRIAPMSLPEVIVVAFSAASAKADPLMAVAVMLTMSVSASNIDDTMPAPRGVFDAVVAWITPIVPTVELTVRFSMALAPLTAVTVAVIGPTFAPWRRLLSLL